LFCTHQIPSWATSKSVSQGQKPLTLFVALKDTSGVVVIRRRDDDPERSHSCGASDSGSMPSSWRICANFIGSARRRSLIIARRALIPNWVKTSRGKRSLSSSRISPRSRRPLAAGEIFGLPRSGPPRHVLSWKPSATVGSDEKNMSSSLRIYARSLGVNSALGAVRVSRTGRERAARPKPPGSPPGRGAAGRTIGPLVSVATRNDERPGAQSRVVFGAQSVRISMAMSARYLRLNARSLRQTRDHRVRRKLVETELPNGKRL